MFSFSPKSCKEISELIGGRIAGNPQIVITNLNRLEDARNGELTFFSDYKYEKYLNETHASCIIVPEDFKGIPGEGRAYIYSTNPYPDFIKIARALTSKPDYPPGIHPKAIIHMSSVVNGSAHIGPLCIIGKNCTIGENVVLVGNVTVYDNVTIEDNTFIHANVIICEGTSIGKNCIIHPGAVIGSDGFGYLERKDGSYEKIPQFGNVNIQDDVEIGANTTIDRAMIGATIIEKGVKLDNLIHIAHNVKVGENTAMAAQTGISGSTKVGRRNRFGGQVGLAGHIETPDDVVIYAQSGVAKSIEKKGTYFGTPIKEYIQAFKIEAALKQLPQLIMDVSQIKKLIGGGEKK